MLPRRIWTLPFITLSFLLPSLASHVSIPLHHHRDPDRSLQHKLRAISKRAAGLQSGNLYYDALDFGSHDWWYGNFDVGDSKNLSLSIDTASGTLFLNSGLYKPSSESVDFNRTIKSGFGTWFADGCGKGNFEANVFRDTVSVSSSDTLVVKNQSFGTLVRHKPAGDLPPFTRDGIMGMSIGTDFWKGTGPGWFLSLCDHESALQQCRFGMALGTKDEGSFVFGGVDNSLFEGDLTPVGKKLGNNTSYPWRANIVINDTEIVIPNKGIGLFDSGTANIRIPPADARKIFKALGMEAVQQPPGWGNCSVPQVVGYYPCDKPPTVGLHMLLSGSTVGPPFNIEPSAFQLTDNGNNNCTSIIVGHAGQGSDWNVGNAWMIGKYTDWSAWGILQGVAKLKDSDAPLNSSTNSSTPKNSGVRLQQSFLGIGLGLVGILFSFLL